jgi:putative transposase
MGSGPKADGSAAAVISSEEAARVLNAGGRLPAATVLLCRVRYFTDGAVLGSKAFVAAALRTYQETTGARRRQTGPIPLRGGEEWSGLTTLRGLHRAVFGERIRRGGRAGPS